MPRTKRRQDGLYLRGKIWWIRYTDSDGRRVRESAGTTDKEQAKLLRAKRVVDAKERQIWGKEPPRQFHDVMTQYVKSVANGSRSEARTGYALKRLNAFFRDRDMHTVTTADLQQYVNDRKAAGVGVGTIKREMNVLSAAINFARGRLGWNIPNPTAALKLKTPPGRVRWITRAEASRLIAAAKANRRAPLLAPFIALALYTGMRRGELLGLEWDRVHLDRGFILLRGGDTKTETNRTIPLHDEALAALETLRRHCATHCPDTPWVFARRNGERLQSIKRPFNAACAAAGLEDFHVHDLRHTCASWLVMAGVPLIEVRDLLGHASTQTTEIYAHLAPHRVRSAVNQLEALT